MVADATVVVVTAEVSVVIVILVGALATAKYQ